jgi:hypothetical protein
MIDIAQPDATLFLRLLLAHFVADFLLQQKAWIEQRAAKRWKAPTLYLHVSIVGLLTYIFSGHYNNFIVPFVVMLAHLTTDVAKSYTGNSLRYFLLDQLIHLLILVFAWYLYLKPAINFEAILDTIFQNQKLFIYITAYFFIIWPSGFLIAKITEGWQKEIDNSKGLADAGRWVGMLERILILTFVMIDQFAGIGFLIAAKSILRFGDIKNADNRKEAEYILLGTMISFIIAIVTGIIVKVTA